MILLDSQRIDPPGQYLSTEDCGFTLSSLPVKQAQATPVVRPTPPREVPSRFSHKNKRKYRPRPKHVPDDKEYVQPTQDDVLTGRGGFTNQNRGNKRYREDLETQKELYRELGDTRDINGRLLKTNVAEAVILRVRENGGRFLDKDTKDGRWYIMSDVAAREKASQALRTNETPEERKAKRTRHLLKKRDQQKAQN